MENQLSESKKLKILSVRSLGLQKVYDIEVPKNHNFVLDGGTVAHNCRAHAASYELISYACAYLKHHFPLEWWCSVLANAKKEEIADVFWHYVHSFVQLPDISRPKKGFEIEGDKIHFPLEFLHGIGEGAQKQIVKYAPYKDLEDFCAKIEYHKELYSNPETTLSVNKKGQQVAKIKRNPGHSAIHSGTAYTMIIAGAMDSFFPENTTLVEKLGRFQEVYAASRNEKVKPVKEEYLNLTAYQEFLLKKSVLPVWGKSLLDVMVDCKHPLISTTYGRPEINLGRWMPVLNLQDYKDILELDLHIPKGGYQVALAGMVTEVRPFTYNKEGKQCEACEVNLEVQGEIFNFVMWPDRKTGQLDKRFGIRLEGCLVVLALNKFSSGRPFAITDLVIVEPPFELDKGK